jgi:antagonist of KipI
MRPAFEVLKPGVLATIQDLGRGGFQKQGVGTAGAMDAFALQAANLLVGNARGEAGLEVGLGGLRLRSLDDQIAALTGAGFAAWKSVRVRKGEELDFKPAERGVWSYLAVAGGFEAERVMGSRSTDLRARIGKPLAKGDVLLSGPSRPAARDGRALVASALPDYPEAVTVRVVPGPEEFPEDVLGAFLSEPFEVTAQSNRMGYRLRGPALRSSGDLLSEGVAWGTVQVPQDGQPIVLMADRQTTGGYARIATVISADLAALAQSRPGSKVSFRSVPIEEAQDAAVELEKALATLQSGCGA